MKTRLSFIAIIMLNSIVVNCFSQTNVSGFISSNTTWSLSGSPYIIVGNTLVDSGFVLTINPGVIIKFNTNKALQISGTLHAVGTSTNPITFTSNAVAPAPGDWQQILFNDNSADYNYSLNTGNIMEYCIVEYAGAASQCGAISLLGSHPFINYCTLRNNNTCGISCYDMYGVSSELIKITNCNIYNNALRSSCSSTIVAGGIDITNNQSGAVIENNLVTHNTGNGTGGISMWMNNTNWTLSNNIIANNSASEYWSKGGGLYITADNLGNVNSNIVYSNLATNGGGIYLEDIRLGGSLINNIVVNNTALVDGGGIYFSVSNYVNPNIQVIKNTIIENKASGTSGFYLPSPTNTTVKYNIITRNHSIGKAANQQTLVGQGSLFNYNNIYNNEGDVSSFYEYFNPLLSGTAKNLDAKNNWWGTISTSAIDAKIFDYFDDGTLSIVYYNPILTSPDTTAPLTPPVNVLKTDLGSGNIKITWASNPENDLAGYKIYWGSPTGYSFKHFVDAGNNSSYILNGVLNTDSIAVTAYDKQMDNINDQFEGHESWYTYAVGKRVPDFVAKNSNVCPNDTVYFLSNTPELYPYANTKWSWSFPNGTPTISNAQNPKVIYSTSGTYIAKLIVTNIAGSDSITYSNFINVKKPSYASISPHICNIGSYISPSGLHTWYNSGTYYDTISNHVGCDSILTIHLTLNNNSYNTISPKACDRYTSPGRNRVWTTTGTYYDTIPNSFGCDSIIAIYLTVYNNNTSITSSENVLTSNALGVSYQWLDCAKGYSIISGEINQSYTPSISGNFALKITQDICIDTSSCYEITKTTIAEINNNEAVSIYPNPSTNIVSLNLKNENNEVMAINIYTVIGILVKSEMLKQTSQQFNMGSLNNGVYTIEIKAKDWIIRQKIVIQK